MIVYCYHKQYYGKMVIFPFFFFYNTQIIFVLWTISCVYLQTSPSSDHRDESPGYCDGIDLGEGVYIRIFQLLPM